MGHSVLPSPNCGRKKINFMLSAFAEGIQQRKCLDQQEKISAVSGILSVLNSTGIKGNGDILGKVT